MKALLFFYPGDQAVLVLVNVLVQVTTVALLAVLVSRTLARRWAAVRYGAGLCALGCVLLSPVVAYLTYRAGLVLVTIPLMNAEVALAERQEPVAVSAPLNTVNVREPVTQPSSAADMVEESATPATPPPAVLAAPDVLSEPPSSARWQPDIVRPVIGALLAVWGAGILWFFARLLHGLGILAALRREVQPLAEHEFGGVLHEVRAALGADFLPPIVTSRLVGSPLAVGVLRPRVVIPHQLPTQLDSQQLRDVLVHECAHILQHDHVVGLLQRLAEMIFWPHPFVHLLNRELARAREEVCDNYVLRSGDAPGYAKTLFSIAQPSTLFRRTPATLGLMEPRWRLEDRVAGLLDERRRLMTRMNRALLVAAGAVFVSAAVVVGGIRWIDAVAAPPDVPTKPVANQVESSPKGEPGAQADAFGGEVNGLRAKIALPASKFVIGDPIPVEYAVKNVSDAEQIIWHSGFWANHQILVLDADGKEAPLTWTGERYRKAFSPGGERSKNSPVTVPAGGEDAAYEKYDLTKLYTLTKPGKYTLQYVYEEKQRGWEGRLASNTVSFELVAVASRPEQTIEKDGVQLEILVPKREWLVPEKPGARAAVNLGLRITNKTEKPLRFSRFDTIYPDVLGPDGKALRRSGGRDGTFGKMESDCPLVKPGESVTFPIDAALFWQAGKLRFGGNDGFGGVWGFAEDFEAGRYKIQISYLSTGVGTEGREGEWLGEVQTPFVEVALSDAVAAVDGGTEKTADDFGEDVRGLRAKVTLPKKKFAVGEAIEPKYVVKNVSPAEQILWTCGFWQNHAILVHGADGKEPPLTELGQQHRKLFPDGQRLRNAPLKVPPGGEDAAYQQYDLTKLYDLTTPGRYTVQYVYEENDEGVPPKGGWSGRLPSNVIAFEVGEAEKKVAVLSASPAVQADDVAFQAVVEPRRTAPARGGQQSIDLGLRIANRGTKTLLLDLNAIWPTLTSAEGTPLEQRAVRKRTAFAAPMLLGPGETQTVLWRGQLESLDDADSFRLRYIDGTAFGFLFEGLRFGKYRLHFQYECSLEAARSLERHLGEIPPGQSIWGGNVTTKQVEFEIVPRAPGSNAAERRPVGLLLAELESADGRTRIAATTDLFAIGKSAVESLEKAGAKPIASAGTINPRRLDVVYSLLKGLPPNPPGARAGYKTTSFGLHLDPLGTQEDVMRMGARHGFSLSGEFQKDARPNCYLSLAEGKSLPDVMQAILTGEGRVLTVSLNYLEE